MTNEDKAKLLAGYSADTAYLDMSIKARRKYADLILMAQWKDCQFKKFLEKKRDESHEKILDYGTEVNRKRELLEAKVIAAQEFIEELFPATEQNKED